MSIAKRGWTATRPYVIQVAVTLAILIAALEIWARLFPPKDQTVWPLRQEPGVGTTFEPNARVTLSNGLDFTTTETANEAGFLDRPLPPAAKPAGTCRVAILGDSFVEAAQVPIADKVQVRLAALAAPHLAGTRIETMAFGFSGTGQLNQLGYYDAHVAQRRPDLVVLVFVGNDYADNSALLTAVRVGWHPAHTPRVFATITPEGRMAVQPISPDWRKHLLPAPPDARPWLHARLHRISRFYRWFYLKLSLQYPSLAQSIGGAPGEADRTRVRLEALRKLDGGYGARLAGWEPGRDPNLDGMFIERDALPPAFEDAIKLTGFAFDEFARRAARDGAKLVVLSGQGMKGRLAARLKVLLDARGIPLLDMDAHIEKTGQPVERAHWRHDSHWSQQGHTWAAEMIAGHMAGAGICGR